jgi:hypothetical protein
MVDLGAGARGEAGVVQEAGLGLDLRQGAAHRVLVVGQGRPRFRRRQGQGMDPGHGLGEGRQVFGQARRPAMDVVHHQRAHGQAGPGR